MGIGTLVIPHQMWVADIADECILGLDFLERHGCQVDLKRGILLIAEEEVPLQQPRKDTEPSSCRVIAQDTVNLSPRSETIVPACLVDFKSGTRWGVLSPGPEQCCLDDLLIGKTLLDFEQERVPGRDLETSPSHVAEEPEMMSNSSNETSDTPEENVHSFHMPGVTENSGLRRSRRQHRPPDRYGHFVTRDV